MSHLLLHDVIVCAYTCVLYLIACPVTLVLCHVFWFVLCLLCLSRLSVISVKIRIVFKVGYKTEVDCKTYEANCETVRSLAILLRLVDNNLARHWWQSPPSLGH